MMSLTDILCDDVKPIVFADFIQTESSDFNDLAHAVFYLQLKNSAKQLLTAFQVEGAFYDWYKSLYLDSIVYAQRLVDANLEATRQLLALHNHENDIVELKGPCDVFEALKQAMLHKSWVDIRLSYRKAFLFVPFRLDEFIYVDSSLQFVGVMTIAEFLRHITSEKQEGERVQALFPIDNHCDITHSHLYSCCVHFDLFRYKSVCARMFELNNDILHFKERVEAQLKWLVEAPMTKTPRVPIANQQ